MRRILVGAVLLLAGCPTHTASPKDAKAALDRLSIAKDYFQKDSLEAAETEANRAIKLNPSLDEAYLVRGLIEFTQAYHTQKTLEIDGCLTGVDAEATHKDLDAYLTKADQDFAKAAELTPDYGEAYANRGVVHTLLEDYPTAVELLTKALDYPARLTSPGLTRANLGWALFHQNKTVEAAKELRQSLQFQPNMCVATYRLGRVYFARKEWEKAAELLDKTSADPNCGSQEASYFLMMTRLQQGLPDDARTARDACLKMSVKSCIAAKCQVEGQALGTGHP